MKILIIGHGRHGKDHAASFIAQNTNLVNAGPTSVALVEELSAITGMPFDELYEIRHNCRKLIYYFGKKIRKERGVLYLVNETLKYGDIVTGVRDECKEAIDLFDMVIWIDASRRVPDDPTMDYTYNDVVKWCRESSKDLHVFYNNDTIIEFERNLSKFCKEILCT